MPEVSSYAAFSAALHQRAARERLPLSVSVEVTRRCPLSCAHCYNNLPAGDLEAARREMSLDEHRRLLDELAGAGTLFLLLTGGEVLARRDFLDIYRHARECGLIVTVFTNATALTPASADALAERRPFVVEVTLYGRTRETYERVTGVPGSYDRCLRGIGLLLERRIPLKLKTVALAANRHEVLAMKRFAEEELGVPFRFDALVNPRLDCSLSPLALRLSPSDVVALDLLDPARRVELERQAAALGAAPAPMLPALATPPPLYECGGGLLGCAVDPYGFLSLCLLSEREKVSVRDGGFVAAWDRFLGAVRARPATRQSRCTACRLAPGCPMCPANGELEAGDPEAPVDFLCEVTHLRTLVTGVRVPPHGDCPFCPGGPEASRLEAEAEALAAGEPMPVVPPSLLPVAQPSGLVRSCVPLP